jgi:hypothetical protein
MAGKVTRETLIKDLEASVRLTHSFKNEYGYIMDRGAIEDGNPRVKHFLGLADHELLRIPNFGRKTLIEWRELTSHLRGDDAPDNEEHLAELKLLRGITAQIRLIAGNHKATGTLYSKLADLIDNIK